LQPLLQLKNSSTLHMVSLFVALVIQHAMRMRHVACPTLQCFSTLSRKGHEFREKKITEHKMSFEFL
jgi:hypothetical protein